MIRFTLLIALVVAGCVPTSAQIHCGRTQCSSNQRCEASTLICVLDEAPVVLIDSPRIGTLVAGDTVTLSGSVRDDNGVATLELSLDEGKTWVKVPMSSGHFAARVALPSMDYQPLGLTLRAHDSLQQAATARVGITVDNIAPAVTVGSPVEGALLNAAWFSAGAKVSGLAADGSGVVLRVDVGGGDVSVSPVGDRFELDWVAPLGEDGVAHQVRVTAVDLAGNKTVVTRQVKVDVVAPEISFTVPAIDALLGTAFFQGGGLVQGKVSAGARVTAELGNGPQVVAVIDEEWAVRYAPAAGLDFQQQLLEVIASDDAGNVTRAARMTTVDLVAPVLTFTAGLQGARLNAASFPSGDDVAVRWTVTDGDPQVAVRNGTTAVVGSSLNVTTSPTDNPKSYALTLSVQDRAGNSSQTQLSFAVDRLRPTVTARTPAVDGRNVSTTAAIEFSEDVTGGPGVTLTPAAPLGTWTTPRHFEVAGLPSDSVFSSAVGAVVDAFGNPVVGGGPVKFHTSPALPVTGTLMTDVARFKAAVDQDGVLTLFTTSPTLPAAFRWVRVNPKTGVVEDNRPVWSAVMGGDFSEVAAYAQSRVNVDLSAQRISAATTLQPSVILERRAWIREGDALATTELGMVGVIPTRAFPAEGAALAEVGFLKMASGAVVYSRVGMPADFGVGMGSPTAMGFAADHWEMVEVRNQVIKHRSFGCSSPFPSLPATCGLSAVGQWTDVTTNEATSYAIADGCSLYVYNSTSGKRVMRTEPYAAACAGRTCPAPFSEESAQFEELRVASDRRESNSFIGALRGAGGAVQLKRLPLGADCHGVFTSVGATVAVPTGAQFEPISLGGKPALIYVDTGNVLKVFVP